MNNTDDDYDYGDLYNKISSNFSDIPVMKYDHYLVSAICSASFGLPSNMLLMAILIRIGLYNRRPNDSLYVNTKLTGSFERFLFEVVFIDTLMLMYHFVDNLLSYINKDRSAGQHHLIHISDFCCKFFTYIAKTGVLLATWLLLFLIINQLLLTMKYYNHNNNNSSFWQRSLYYVNAKYSTVFLIFIFSVCNIYPIEILKHQEKKNSADYNQGDNTSACLPDFDRKNSTSTLKTVNYVYNLLGIAIPCVVMLIISLITIYRTFRNDKHKYKEDSSYYYIAGMIGILHSLTILPDRLSRVLVLSLKTTTPSYERLLVFNHHAEAYVFFSYSYKFLICILFSRRFRMHAKSILCFLIENKYEDYHITKRIDLSNVQQNTKKRKRRKRGDNSNGKISSYNQSNGDYIRKKFLSPYINRDIFSDNSSDATSWIRSYFIQNEKRSFLRPCGRSSSCQQLSTTTYSSLSSNTTQSSETRSPKHLFTTSTVIHSIHLPNGEYLHIPLPQKRVSQYRQNSDVSLSPKTMPNSLSNKNNFETTVLLENIELTDTKASKYRFYYLIFIGI